MVMVRVMGVHEWWAHSGKELGLCVEAGAP